MIAMAAPSTMGYRKAARMGHDVRTHMKHYGQWIDDQDMEKEVDAANMAMAGQSS